MDKLYGREVITTSENEITRENLLGILEDAIEIHNNNVSQMDYLYEYYKGKQPIYDRTKEVRPEINNKICENRANEIVAFKTGYLVGEPVQYSSVTGDQTISEQVMELNSLMRSENKAQKDKDLVEWQHIVGTGYRFVVPDAEYDPEGENEQAPFEMFTLDPRQAFVIYSTGIGQKALAGVYLVEDSDDNATYFIYTKDRYYVVEEDEIIDEQDYALGIIPIIEYPANQSRLGAFEPVITILDALNVIDSNRVDGVEQTVQQLCVATNCQFEEGVTANTIREAGMIQLKSSNDNKADFTILSEELKQAETQVLKDDLIKSYLSICGMPSLADSATSDSSNNGAVILRNGWQTAEARAKDSELMFKGSETTFLKLVLRICTNLNALDLRIGDVETKFTRRNYEDGVSKSQILINMLSSDKIAPKLAFQHCGMFTDSEEAYRESMDWYEATLQEQANQDEGTSSVGQYVRAYFRKG